jgi:hypothetical protein
MENIWRSGVGGGERKNDARRFVVYGITDITGRTQFLRVEGDGEILFSE